MRTNADAIEVEILPDGTVKVTTDAVSGPNHMNAESLLRDMALALGGAVDRQRRKEMHHHHHHHHHHGHTHRH